MECFLLNHFPTVRLMDHVQKKSALVHFRFYMVSQKTETPFSIPYYSKIIPTDEKIYTFLGIKIYYLSTLL